MTAVAYRTWRHVVAGWLIRLALWVLLEKHPTVRINGRRIYGPDAELDNKLQGVTQ